MLLSRLPTNFQNVSKIMLSGMPAEEVEGGISLPALIKPYYTTLIFLFSNCNYKFKPKLAPGFAPWGLGSLTGGYITDVRIFF